MSEAEKSAAVQAIDEAFARLKVMEDAYRAHFGPIPTPAEREGRHRRDEEVAGDA
jgi:hypothetical protein